MNCLVSSCVMLCVLWWLQCELIEFYYHWKKTPAGMDTRAIRRQKKQQHIKTARQYFKLQQDPSQELGKSCLILVYSCLCHNFMCRWGVLSRRGWREWRDGKRYSVCWGIFCCNSLLLLLFFTFSDYICAHCSTRESPSWHHAGPNRQLMCDECRLYYNKYGEMRQYLKGISKEVQNTMLLFID